MEDSSNIKAAAPEAEVDLVEEEEEEQQLVPKKNASSIVWLYFNMQAILVQLCLVVQ